MLRLLLYTEPKMISLQGVIIIVVLIVVGAIAWNFLEGNKKN